MSKYWEKGLEAMQSRRRWELFLGGGYFPALPHERQDKPIRFYAKNKEMAIIHACDLLNASYYNREGDSAHLYQYNAEGRPKTWVGLEILDNICITVDDGDCGEFLMLWNGKTWEREEIDDDVDILNLTKSPFWPKEDNNETT